TIPPQNRCKPSSVKAFQATKSSKFSQLCEEFRRPAFYECDRWDTKCGSPRRPGRATRSTGRRKMLTSSDSLTSEPEPLAASTVSGTEQRCGVSWSTCPGPTSFCAAPSDTE